MRCVLLLLRCFPQTQTWVPPLLNSFLTRIQPHFLFYQNTRAWWSFGSLIRLKWVLFSLYPPLRLFSLVAEERGRNSGEHIHSFYLPVQVTAEMNYPLVSQSCIKLFLICPTANVTTSKAVMTSHYGNHTFTTGTSLSVCMSFEVSTYLTRVQPPRSGKSWPEISAYDRRPWMYRSFLTVTSN